MTSDVALEHVAKTYDSTPAVDDVSFDVAPGSFFSLLGPSGCGKTTILRMIAGFVTPDRGDVFIRGVRVTEAPPYRRDTAMVFQNYALFPHMTVFDNVAYGLRYRGATERERAVKVGHTLEQVRLAGHDTRYPSQLSGGQQQRVALARAIVTEPALLLLDEPLSNLDLRLRQEMRSELSSIQRDIGITTVYVTHDQGEAFSMSDRIAVMDRGRIVQTGAPDEIFSNPVDEFVVTFIGETNRLPGSVVSEDAQEVTVRTDANMLFRVYQRPGSPRRAKNSRVNVFFREEQVRLTNDQSNGNCYPGTVVGIQNLGSMHTYTVRLTPDVAIRSTMATTSVNTLSVGQEVYVAIDPRDCVVVKSTDGERSTDR